MFTRRYEAAKKDKNEKRGSEQGDGFACWRMIICWEVPSQSFTHAQFFTASNWVRDQTNCPPAYPDAHAQ